MRPITLSLLALMLAACPSPRAPGAADSTGASAAADTSTPAAPAAPAPADSTRHPGFTLVAEGHKVQGSAGCNRMMGTYTLDGEKLKFGPLATTRMACPAMETESAFLKALAATTRYEVSGSSLTLFGADTAVARLDAAAKPS